MLYLSQAIGRPVLDANGEPLGKVDDLIVAVGDRYPPVTGLVVVTDRRRIFLPWSQVARFDAAGRGCRAPPSTSPASPSARTRSGCAPTCSTSRSSTSTAARSCASTTCASTTWTGSCTWWRSTSGRPGCCAGWGSRARTGSWPATCGCRRPERYIDWEDVDPVETSIASIRLRVPHAGLTELHPADLATIIDQLAPRDRAGVLAALDDEAVADAIEEMEPETQVEVLEGLAPRTRRGHPRGDVARRRRGPRRRPVGQHPPGAARR